MNPIITIDGPSGVGKGSTSHKLASILKWQFLDSGAIYRAFALYVKLQKAEGNTETDEALAIQLPIHFNEDNVLLNGRIVNELIRNESVAYDASILASRPEIRSKLLQRQRDFATPEGLVADGRDMGTVVFPEAPLKFFLMASATERAKRRVLQLETQGSPCDYEEILALIEQRDASDKARANSPLKPADDAIIIDNSDLSLNQVVEQMLAFANQTGLLVRKGEA